MSTNSESQGLRQAPVSPQSWDTGEMQETGAPPGDGGGGGGRGQVSLAHGVSLRETFP